MATPHRGLLIAAFASVYIFWGASFLGLHYAIQTLPPFFLGALRFLVAGAVLYGWARLRGAPGPTRPQWRVAFIAGAFFMLVGQGGVAWGQDRLPTGVAAVLVGTIPMWVLLLEWLRPRGSRPGRLVSLGLLSGFAGVVILVAPWDSGAGQVDLLGALSMLLAAGAWAGGSVYVGGADKPGSLAQTAGMQMMAGGLLLLLLATVRGELGAVSSAAVSAGSVAALAYLTVFSSIIAFGAYSWLLGVCSPTRVATFAYVNPVVAVALGSVVLSEPLSPRMVVAMAVTVCAVALVGTAPARTDSAAVPSFEAPCCFETVDENAAPSAELPAGEFPLVGSIEPVIEPARA